MPLVELTGSVGAGSPGAPVQALRAKRLVDIGLGVPLCLVALPVVALLAFVIAVRHRGNPFFVHDRIGRGGRIIAIPKLRTLRRGTHPYADKTVVALEAPDRLSQFLRTSHIDELPQLFLVPLGWLSLVGPRPRMVSEAQEHADERYEALRTSVPQGCTGLWQISGASGRVSDSPEFDRFYVAQQTLRLDMWILWRTLRQVFLRRPTRLTDIPRWALRRPELAVVDGV